MSALTFLCFFLIYFFLKLIVACRLRVDFIFAYWSNTGIISRVMGRIQTSFLWVSQAINSLGDVLVILKVKFLKPLYRIVASLLLLNFSQMNAT